MQFDIDRTTIRHTGQARSLLADWACFSRRKMFRNRPTSNLLLALNANHPGTGRVASVVDVDPALTQNLNGMVGLHRLELWTSCV